MKKYFYLAAVSAMMLTACSSDNDVVQPTTAQPTNPVAVQQKAVAFDTYLSNTTASTRAGDPGIQTTSTLQAADKGFGVFAVQSDNTVYDASQTTNFMWNEHVTYAAPGWTYSPLKYWPNETDNDSQSANAESDHIDRLSFFAYAPYVQERNGYDGMLTGVGGYLGTPSATNHFAAAGNTGIVAISSNHDATYDPYVWYVASPIPSESVDLLWGVAPAGGLNYTSVAKSVTANPAGVTTTLTTGTVTVPEGMPLVDLVKPSKDEKMKFLFKHALARLGVTVVAAIDQISAGGNLDAATRVAVESIVINASTGTNKLYSEGRLNLNNTTAGQSLWTPTVGKEISALTIDATHELSKEILWDTDVATTISEASFNGVDKTERYAMREGGVVANDPAYFMLIPSHANTDLKVTITYYVFTEDAKLVGGYAITKNVIDKTITIPTLTNNKAYNLKLILGLTSVKLEAEVADWENIGSTPIDLPQNN